MATWRARLASWAIAASRSAVRAGGKAPSTKALSVSLEKEWPAILSAPEALFALRQRQRHDLVVVLQAVRKVGAGAADAGHDGSLRHVKQF